jgi:hypothetical protein
VDKTGKIQVNSRTFTPKDDRTNTEFTVSLGAGFVQNLTVSFVGTGTFSGLCYVTVDLIRGLPPGATTLVGQLLGGYIRPGAALTWPGSPVMSSTEGRGFQRFVAFPQPGLGNDLAISQPLLVRWQVRGVFVELVASAVVATRTPFVKVDGPTTGRMATIPAGAAVTAGRHWFMNWTVGATPQVDATYFIASAPFPDGWITPSLTTFGTATGAIDAGDSYSGQLLVEEWLEANV